jgi:hypothetical protein
LNEPVQSPRIEPRWPVALTVVLVLFLLEMLPGRIRVLPHWVADLLAIALLVPMAGVTLTSGKAWWLRIERATILVFFMIVAGGMLANLGQLIAAIVRRSGQISGMQLLASSIALWVVNVLTFSLLYWQLDRSGPEARTNNPSRKPDWLFTQEANREEVPPNWRPTFLDYLFLGYSTATALSSTDVPPLTSRAKLLMMFESGISLVTIVVVASRAINILGS